MTLVLGVIRPNEGAWLCVDFRLTAIGGGATPLDNDARKLLALQCIDGPLLLGFAGQAHVGRPELHFADWARTTLRGEKRSIRGTLLFLTERLNRDMPMRWRKHLTVVAGIAFKHNADGTIETWSIQIANNWIEDGAPHATPEFTIIGTVIEADEGPTLLCLGSGVSSISDGRRLALLKIIHNKPRKAEDFLGLIAAEIRRVSRIDTTVSPWSHGCYISPSDGPVAFRVYRRPGDEAGSPDRMTPFLHLGVDVSELLHGYFDAEAACRTGELSHDRFISKIVDVARRATQQRP